MKTLLLLPLLLPAFETGTQPANDDTPGKITGQVTFGGDERPEPLSPLTIGSKESEGCVHGGQVADENRTLRIDSSGGVADVVLTVSVKGMDPEVPSEPIVIDQEGCRFEPHVTVVPVGATVRYANSDEVNHNVHTYAVKNRQLNNNIAGGAHEEQELTKEEEIKITCDIHPWMSSYIVVTEDPVYAVSALDGSYTLEGLPPGEYKVSWWHEKLGKGKSEDVTVEAGKTAAIDIEVGGEDDGGRGRGRGRRRR